MRLDTIKMVQHHVYTPHFGVTYQGQKVVQVDPHFGVKWLIQYFWCHLQVQTQIFGSNMNLNPLIQSGPGLLPALLNLVPKHILTEFLYKPDTTGVRSLSALIQCYKNMCHLLCSSSSTSSWNQACKPCSWEGIINLLSFQWIIVQKLSL